MPYYDDTLTRAGAEDLARRLDAYWHARGWPLARHWAEPFKTRSEAGPLYGIRSNLKNGNPPLRAEPEWDEDGLRLAMELPFHVWCATMRKAWTGFRAGLVLKNA